MPSDENLRQPLSSALRFAASRSAITAEQERSILAAFDAATVIDEALAKRDAEIARLREALAMAVADMSYARGRLETIAICNEDRRVAAKLGCTCDFARAAFSGEYRKDDHG